MWKETVIITQSVLLLSHVHKCFVNTTYVFMDGIHAGSLWEMKDLHLEQLLLSESDSVTSKLNLKIWFPSITRFTDFYSPHQPDFQQKTKNIV